MAKQELIKKGQKAIKKAGRKPGVPNKDKAELMARIQETVERETGLSNWDPVLQMAIYAAEQQKIFDQVRKGDMGIKNMRLLDQSGAITCAKEVAQYVHAKRKAIEISGNDQSPVVFKIIGLEEIDN